MQRKAYFFIVTLLFTMNCFTSLEARLYFLHVPKTGGTTLRLLLESQLNTKEIYPYKNTIFAKDPISGELVSGHFPYSFCKKNDEHFNEAFKVTILREPVERYLSFLRAKKKADTTLPDLESIFRLRLSKNNKYASDLVDNALCRYLAPDPHLQGEALFEKAKQALEEFDYIVFFDHFTEDVIGLFKQLGIDLNEDDIPKINTTEAQPVSSQLLEEVRKINEWDTQLYEYAKKYFSNKDAKYSLRTSSFDEVTKKTAEIDYTFDFPLYGNGWTYRDTYTSKTIENPIYRWVMDYPAKIYFSLETELDYVISFNAWSLTEACIPRLKVNGEEIELTRLSDDLFSLYQGVIPKNCITQEFTEILFYSDKAVRYRDVYMSSYNRNHPPLSFAVNRIQIGSSGKYPYFLNNGIDCLR